ncbi:MAG: hypothetical protein Q9226_007163 [Calogaya cf. arnoldii]
MDPFSVTVGVAGLLTLTAKTIQATRSFCYEAMHAKEFANELLVELYVLQFNLSQLDKLLRRDTAAAFSSTSVLTTSTQGCRNKLTMLHDKIDKAATHPLHRFRWPLTSDEHRKTIQELRAFAQWIQFALTIDGSSLLAKTSTEVIDILANQLQTFRLLNQVHTTSELTYNTVVDIQDTVRTSEASKEREVILNWISNAKTSQKHHDIRLPRVEGTGEWLLQEPAFQDWRDGQQTVLWCYGIQGSGKSTLASLVIDHLSHKFPNDQAAVAHVYFDYRDQEHQSIESTIASLLKQVANTLPRIPTVVTALYQKFAKQQQNLELRDLLQALSSTCQEHNAVYIMFDALDECESTCRKGLFKHLDELKGSAKVFVTSRPYPDDVREAFRCTSQIEIKAHSADIERYINERIRNSDISDDIDDAFQREIVKKVVQGAQEMFLLAVLHVQAILNEPTVGDMEDALDRLPQDLQTAFEETIQRIKRQSETCSNIALQTLRLICRARRPMLLSELRDALAFRPRLISVNRKYRPSREKLLDSCHGLVTIDEESQIIRLVHHAVYTFLLGNQEDLIRDERLLAKLCIDYQMLQPFTSGCCHDEDEIVERLTECPFVVYAARYWGFHVLAADSLTIDEYALDFLRGRPQLACSYQIWQYAQGRREEYWEAEEAVSCNPLHIAAMFGLHDFAAKLLPDYAIDEPTHIGTTALMKASSCGHRTLVSLLMDRNADPTKHNWYGSVLHVAAEAGEVGCIHELLDRGVDVNIEDDHGRVPLVCAAESGHTRAMRALLDRGADVNFFHRGGGTPLFVAIQHGTSPKIVKLLLDYGADANIPSVHGSSPLFMAARDINDDIEVARIILEYGSNVETPGEKGERPLHIAAAVNNIRHLRLFLDRGANIDAKSDNGATALCTATQFCSVDAMKLLLGKGADFKIANDMNFAPLDYAKRYQDSALVQLFLDAGANPQEQRQLPIVRDDTRLRTAQVKLRVSQGIAIP